MSASSGQVQACAGSLNVAGTITASSVTGDRLAVNKFVGTTAAPIVITGGSYTFPNASTSSGIFSSPMAAAGGSNFINLLVAPGTPFDPRATFPFVTVASPLLFLFDVMVQPSATGYGLAFVTPAGAAGNITFAFSHI